MPRTGTTFLHNLLKQDPALRAPMQWELVEPLPAAGATLGAAHVAALQAQLDQYTQLLPGIEEIHPMEATMAELERVQESIEAANLWELVCLPCGSNRRDGRPPRMHEHRQRCRLRGWQACTGTGR